MADDQDKDAVSPEHENSSAEGEDTTAQSNEEVLTQEEIDALLANVDDEDGAVDSDNKRSNVVEGLGRVKVFDFSKQQQSMSAGLPLLNVIHERFALELTETIFTALRCSNKVAFAGTRSCSFVDYINSLDLPTHINFVRLDPMQGLGMVNFNVEFITTALSAFFGGVVSGAKTGEKKDFTPAEERMGNMLLKHVLEGLQNTWRGDIDISPSLRQTETNPDFAQLMNPAEPLLINRFEVTFEQAQGVFDLVTPVAMIEPYREQFSVTYQSDSEEGHGAWAPIIIEEIKDTSVSVHSVLANTTLSLGQVLRLKPGDVIPIKLAELVNVYAEDIPVFEGEFGASNERNAVKIVSKKRRV